MWIVFLFYLESWHILVINTHVILNSLFSFWPPPLGCFSSLSADLAIFSVCIWGWVMLRGENELFHPPSCTLYSISIFFLIYFTSINSSVFLLLILISLLYDTNKWHLHSRHLGIRLKRQGVWHGEYADGRGVWQIFLLRLLSPAPELLCRSEIQTPIWLGREPLSLE